MLTRAEGLNGQSGIGFLLLLMGVAEVELGLSHQGFHERGLSQPGSTFGTRGRGKRKKEKKKKKRTMKM